MMQTKEKLIDPGFSITLSRLRFSWPVTYKIIPIYCRFIAWITRYYPFSLLYEGSLIHADNIKARNLMREMEATAKDAGIPVYINNGQRDRNFSVFYGKMERGGINKEEAIKKMQQLFQDKFGMVYVQKQKTGFRVLVDTGLL